MIADGCNAPPCALLFGGMSTCVRVCRALTCDCRSASPSTAQHTAVGSEMRTRPTPLAVLRVLAWALLLTAAAAAAAESTTASAAAAVSRAADAARAAAPLVADASAGHNALATQSVPLTNPVQQLSFQFADTPTNTVWQREGDAVEAAVDAPPLRLSSSPPLLPLPAPAPSSLPASSSPTRVAAAAKGNGRTPIVADIADDDLLVDAAPLLGTKLRMVELAALRAAVEADARIVAARDGGHHAASVAVFNASSLRAVEQLLQQCWHSDDAMQMFTDETCHVVHRLFLSRAEVVAVDMVEEAPRLGSKLNGGFRVRFANGMLGMFKSCSLVSTDESWKSEIIAHAVDRLLGLHRVPAVVGRVLSVDELRRAHVAPGMDQRHLNDIVRTCNNNGALVGSVMGWTNFPLATVEEFGTRFMAHAQWPLRALPHADVEWVRLVLTLVLSGYYKKVNHNIAQAVFNYTADAPHELILIGIDNDRAQWMPNHREHLGKKRTAQGTNAGDAKGASRVTIRGSDAGSAVVDDDDGGGRGAVRSVRFDVSAARAMSAAEWNAWATSLAAAPDAAAPSDSTVTAAATTAAAAAAATAAAAAEAAAAAPAATAIATAAVRIHAKRAADATAATRGHRPRVCERCVNCTTFTCALSLQPSHDHYMGFLSSACIWPASVVRRLWLFGARGSNNDRHYGFDINEEVARAVNVATVGFGEQPHESHAGAAAGAAGAASAAGHRGGGHRPREEVYWTVLPFAHYNANVLRSKVAELRHAFTVCMSRHAGEYVVFHDEPGERVGKSARVEPIGALRDENGHVYHINSHLGTWRMA